MTRGYHNYRGNQLKGWKILLAILLILVIIVAGGVMLLQEHIVYDENGVPYLKNPWAQEEIPATTPTPSEEEEPPLDLVIQEPIQPVKEEIRTCVVPEGTLTQTAYHNTLLNAGETCNAVTVTVKGSGGNVYFDSATAVSGTVRIGSETADTIARITGSDQHSIARFSCFLDSKAANSNVKGMGLKNTGGYIFYDGNNAQWLDPGKADATAYLCQLAKEAAELGFDEILLTDVSYPLAGKLNKIDYGAAKEVKETVEEGRTHLLVRFLQEMRTALEPYGVALSIELSETVLSQGYDETAGLVIGEIVPLVDRVYGVADTETAAAYEDTIALVNETAIFVPILTAGSETAEGNWMIP